MNLDFQYKILFLGDTEVGKTSLLIRYSDNKFENDGLPTLGVDLRNKYVQIENKKIRLDLWDTAGQERFLNITKNYFKGSHGIIFVCDVTKKKTYERLKIWIEDAKSNVSEKTEMIIAGNKIDLQNREVSKEELKNISDKYNIPFLETSAKTGEGVEEIFNTLIHNIFQKKDFGIYIHDEEENKSRKNSLALKKSDANDKNNNIDTSKCNC